MRVTFPAFGMILGIAGSLLFPVTSTAAVRPHHHTSAHAIVRHTSSSRPIHLEYSSADRGFGMSSDRATQIQSALIQHGYLSGEPTGTWDTASFSAMQKLQGDNGWQTKMVPDSRALIKLGLGPGSTPVPASASPASSAPSSVGTPVVSTPVAPVAAPQNYLNR